MALIKKLRKAVFNLYRVGGGRRFNAEAALAAMTVGGGFFRGGERKEAEGEEDGGWVVTVG